MPEIIWGRYERAYEAIHNAILSSITSAPEGKRVTKIEFEWNADKSLKALKAFQNNELLFTLNFAWTPDGTLKAIERTE